MYCGYVQTIDKLRQWATLLMLKYYAPPVEPKDTAFKSAAAAFADGIRR